MKARPAALMVKGKVHFVYPQDIVAGDIVSKRSLWEQKGSPKPESNIKVS